VPTVITDSAGEPLGPLRRGDQVIAFNFRADRMREICHALATPEFAGFDRGQSVVYELVGMTEYDPKIPFRGVAYAPQAVKQHISEVVGGLGRTQFKCAET